ncbi:MAG: hypothetical protein WBM80_05170 [Woeseiaceae bacterium]
MKSKALCQALPMAAIELAYPDDGITSDFGIECYFLLTAIGAPVIQSGALEGDEDVEIIETGGLARFRHFFNSDRDYDVWHDEPMWPFPPESYAPQKKENPVTTEHRRT